jgi:hypothetical protein
MRVKEQQTDRTVPKVNAVDLACAIECKWEQLNTPPARTNHASAPLGLRGQHRTRMTWRHGKSRIPGGD